MPRDVYAPFVVPPWAWYRDDLRSAVSGRDIGGVLRAVQKYTGASQGRLASATGLLQGRISELLRGTRVVSALEVFERLADGLDMPDDSRMALGLAPRRRAGLRHEQNLPDEVVGSYPSQDHALAHIRAATRRAPTVDVLAVRGLGIFGMTDSVLRRSLASGCMLRVLLLHPESDAAAVRARELGEERDSFVASVHLATARLRELRAARADLTVECYYYMTLPTWRIIAPEPTMFLSSFGPDTEGHRSAMYRLTATVRGGTLCSGFRRFLDDQRRIADRVM